MENKSLEFEIFDNINKVPEIWDEIAGDSIFLKREYLDFLHRENYCCQQYHLSIEDKIILVTYRLKLNIFSLLGKSGINIPVNVVGIPLSVSDKGYSFLDNGSVRLSNYLNSLQGINVVLNGEDDLYLVKGNTLSSFCMEVKWNNFEEYLYEMRSHYRYRTLKALKKFNPIKIKKLEHEKDFTENIYSLYLEVYNNSKEKLEKLSIEFFRKFYFEIFVFYMETIPVGFVQLKMEEDNLIFMFCGFDHKKNYELDLYMNMLLFIVRKGIDSKCKKIFFGQTTEESKFKIGCFEEEKKLYIGSRSKLIRLISKSSLKIISYRRYKIKHKVFKEKKEN
jgi:hypothetical protein